MLLLGVQLVQNTFQRTNFRSNHPKIVLKANFHIKLSLKTDPNTTKPNPNRTFNFVKKNWNAIIPSFCPVPFPDKSISVDVKVISIKLLPYLLVKPFFLISFFSSSFFLFFLFWSIVRMNWKIIVFNLLFFLLCLSYIILLFLIFTQ